MAGRHGARRRGRADPPDHATRPGADTGGALRGITTGADQQGRADGRAAALVDRAIAAGSVRDDVNTIDVARLIEVFSRSHAASSGDDDDEQIQRRLSALALDGLRHRAADPLPGAPPTAAAWAGRWVYRAG